MDYKEQIEELRFLSSHVPEQMCDADGKDPLEKAADALETLLAERDSAIAEKNAAIEDLKSCEVCKHYPASVWKNTCAFCRDYGNWEWRGPRRRIKKIEEKEKLP